MRATFPDGCMQCFTPFVLSVTTDLPEMAMEFSFGYGLRTAFPCTEWACARFHGILENIGELHPAGAYGRTAMKVPEWYKLIDQFLRKVIETSSTKL